MVPRLRASSSLLMPSPESEMVIVRAALSGTMRIFESAGPVSSALVRPSKRRRSVASGRVGDELAQEDLAIRVERVHHEVEQPSDLRAEFVPFQCLAHLCLRVAVVMDAICRRGASVST